MFVSSLLLFDAEVFCTDVIGDGYAMGTDPHPIVIGQSCASWRFMQESTSLAMHAVFSALLAASLGIVAGSIAWIVSWRKRLYKKLVWIILMIVLASIMFIILTYIVSRFYGGYIVLYENSGMLATLSCLFVSMIASLAVVRLVAPRRSTLPVLQPRNSSIREGQEKDFDASFEAPADEDKDKHVPATEYAAKGDERKDGRIE